MSRGDILDIVIGIIRNEFDDDELEITENTVAADVEEWDSLAQLSIIHETEKAFKIKFTINEIKSFQNVGEMIDIILLHLGEA